MIIVWYAIIIYPIVSMKIENNIVVTIVITLNVFVVMVKITV